MFIRFKKVNILLEPALTCSVIGTTKNSKLFSSSITECAFTVTEFKDGILKI